MADKTISDLTQAESIGSEDLFVLEQGGEAKKLKGARLVKYAQDTVGEQVTAATEAAESAETAKTGAESAQTQAQAARDAILNMLVEAITLESGASATVEKSLVDAVYKLTFGLPRGEKGEKGSSVVVSVTLSASGWAADTKTQTVSVSGVTASSNGSLRIAQSATDDQFSTWGAAQPRVTAQSDGSITVKLAGTVPTIDIPVEVLIV